MTAGVTAFLRRFYQVQVNRDYGTLRTLTTNRYQRDVIDHLGFPRWVENQQVGAQWFRNPQNISATIVDTDASDGTVTVSVHGMGYAQPKSHCSMWDGITWVRYENGHWRHDPSPAATAARRSEWDGRDKEIIGEAGGCIVF